MTTTYTTKVRATPTGEITVTATDEDASAYGPVEIAWYPDRLEITALGAGRASITPLDQGQNMIVQLRPQHLDRFADVVPGAD
ncbi:MAG TPA: hypothetical protein VLD13_07045 [Gaiellaceae bacterium]|nr:hypothetical protein [Gaiellaceae bacterium]